MCWVFPSARPLEQLNAGFAQQGVDFQRMMVVFTSEIVAGFASEDRMTGSELAGEYILSGVPSIHRYIPDTCLDSFYAGIAFSTHEPIMFVQRDYSHHDFLRILLARNTGSSEGMASGGISAD